MNQKASSKIVYINYILSVFVVMIHATNWKIYNLHDSFSGQCVYNMEMFLDSFYAISVRTFILMSAYLFYRDFSVEKWLGKLKRRINTLLIPYVIWETVAFLFYWIIYHISFIKDRMNGTPVFSIRTYLLGGWDAPVGFIRHLILMILISSTCLVFAIKTTDRLWEGIKYIIIVAILAYLLYRNPQDVSHWFFYLTGMLLGMVAKNQIEEPREWNRPVGIISLLIWIGICVSPVSGGFWEIIRVFSGIIGLWYGLDIIIPDGENKRPKWWMTISFFIFCAHSMLLESIEKIIWIIGGDTPLFAFLDYWVSGALTIGILTATAKVAMLKAPLVWKVVSGGRGKL